MSETSLCYCNHITVKNHTNIELQDVSVDIKPHCILAILSKDGSASDLIKAIAGLKRIDKGRIGYLNGKERVGRSRCEFMQYIPACSIQYSNLDVASFMEGTIGGRKEWLEEAVRMLAACKIDVQADLSVLTQEQKRLLSAIQALTKKPQVLLWDSPFRNMSVQKYGILLKEVIQLYANGSAIVLTGSDFEEIGIPCHTYLFMRDGKIRGQLNRSQLPQLASVVTLWGGTTAVFDSRKMIILKQEEGYCRFIYNEEHIKELAICLSLSGCRNFNVQTLTMEETLFAEYERWQT